MIEKIQRVPLREIWKHEARDFTTWLQENLDVVNDVIGITLANAEREHSAGHFNVDLVAEDNSGNSVIIENQLEKSIEDADDNRERNRIKDKKKFLISKKKFELLYRILVFDGKPTTVPLKC